MSKPQNKVSWARYHDLAADAIFDTDRSGEEAIIVKKNPSSWQSDQDDYENSYRIVKLANLLAQKMGMERIDSDNIDGFIERGVFKIAWINGDFSSFDSDGFLLSYGYPSGEDFGFQIALDDSTDGTIAVRGLESSTWGPWHTLYHDGTIQPLTFGSKTYDGSAAKEIVKDDLGLGNVENLTANQILARLAENNIYALLSDARKAAIDSGVSDEVLSAIDDAIASLTSRMDDAEEDISTSQTNITALQTLLTGLTTQDISDLHNLISWFGFDASKNMVYIKPGSGSSGAPADRGLFAYGAISAAGASPNTGGGGGGGGEIPHIFLTEAEYEALEIKDPGTLYFTYEEE